MSYLLEALRKSERERQQQSPVPGLQTPTIEWESGDEPRQRSPWLLVAVAAILLNTILLAVLVWRFGFADHSNTSIGTGAAPAATGGPAQTPSSAGTTPVQTLPAQTAPAVIVVQQPASTTPAIIVRERTDLPVNVSSNANRSLTGNTASALPQRELQSASTSAGVTGNTGVSERATRDKAEPSGSMGLTGSTGPAEPAVAGAELPTVHALPISVRQQLPLLSMNSHIYASSARDSFVMINGVSLNPGDRISEGLKLVAVVPEGAVLDFNGQRFLLPALASFSP